MKWKDGLVEMGILYNFPFLQLSKTSSVNLQYELYLVFK
jgi:hypothetical protein